MDVVQIVFIALHAHLAVSMLLVGDWFKKGRVMVLAHVVVVLVRSNEILLVFSRPSLRNPVEVLHRELLFSLCDAGTVAVRSHHVEFVNIVLLSQTQLGHRHGIVIYLTIQMSRRRRLLVDHDSELGLSYSHLQTALGRADARAARRARQGVALGRDVELFELVEDLAACEVSDHLLLLQITRAVVLAVIRCPQIQL